MRILLLTQFYPPETGAAQNRLADLVRRLAQSSHIVTVLTSLPSYPAGQIFEGYRGHLLMEGKVAGVRILRVWSYATKKKGFIFRMASYLSFAGLALLVGIWRGGQQELIIAESPPLFLAFSGWVLSRQKRAKLLMNISDLWPEAAIALGILRSKTSIRLATWLAEFLYRHADLITGQTKGIVESVRGRCAGKPIALMPNGVDADQLISPYELCQVRQRIREEFGIQEKFVVGYTGLHGLTQGLEIVLQAARILLQKKEVIFLFFGDGPEKPELSRIAADAQLSNVRFFPPQPISSMPEILAALDVALVPVRRHRLFDGALPSKLLEAMGAGLPVVVTLDGESRFIVDESRGGICVEPENPEAMAEAILSLYRNPSWRTSLGQNGRQYVLRHYNRKDVADRFQRFILDSSSARCETT